MAQEIAKIVGGPSKYDLMLALFERTYEKPRPVTFRVKHKPDSQTLAIIVHVDIVKYARHQEDTFIIEVLSGDFQQRYKGRYDTKTRSGFLFPVEQEKGALMSDWMLEKMFNNNGEIPPPQSKGYFPWALEGVPLSNVDIRTGKSPTGKPWWEEAAEDEH